MAGSLVGCYVGEISEKWPHEQNHALFVREISKWSASEWLLASGIMPKLAYQTLVWTLAIVW